MPNHSTRDTATWKPYAPRHSESDPYLGERLYLPIGLVALTVILDKLGRDLTRAEALVDRLAFADICTRWNLS